MTDGPAPKTVNTGSIVFKVDGISLTTTVTSPSAGITRITVPPYLGHWTIAGHTNILTYSDNGGNTYSNWWPFNVMNLNYAAVIPVPLTNRVDPSAVDHTKPGWRVKSYQTTAGQANTARCSTIAAHQRGPLD